MRPIQRLLAALPLGFLVCAAGPEPQTVFGLTLGEPLSLPVCAHRVLHDGTLSITYEHVPTQTCYEPDIQLSNAPWRQGSVDFPLDRTPLILSINSGFTLIIDGKLEGLDFDTLGYDNAPGVIGELTTKFGKPTSVIKTTSAVAGLPVPALQAVWNLPTLKVRYLSADGSVGNGSLLIETNKMQALRLGWEKHQAAERTKL